VQPLAPPKVFIHSTHPDHLPSIHASGLIPGKESGIGLAEYNASQKRATAVSSSSAFAPLLPISGKSQSIPIKQAEREAPFPNQVFVSTNHRAYGFASQEGGGADVGVLSTRSPQPDDNYVGGTKNLQLGDAGYFSRRHDQAEGTAVIPPLRDFSKSRDKNVPYSFTLPLTPRSRLAASEYLSSESQSISKSQSEDYLEHRLKQEFSLHSVNEQRGRGVTTSSSSREQKSRSPSPVRRSDSNDDIFEFED
jgi:hypothetical protein